MSRRIRIAALSTHPIPYHVPLFRKIYEQPSTDLMVFYDKDFVNGISYDRDGLPPEYLKGEYGFELTAEKITE